MILSINDWYKHRTTDKKLLANACDVPGLTQLIYRCINKKVQFILPINNKLTDKRKINIFIYARYVAANRMLEMVQKLIVENYSLSDDKKKRLAAKFIEEIDCEKNYRSIPLRIVKLLFESFLRISLKINFFSPKEQYKRIQFLHGETDSGLFAPDFYSSNLPINDKIALICNKDLDKNLTIKLLKKNIHPINAGKLRIPVGAIPRIIRVMLIYISNCISIGRHTPLAAYLGLEAMVSACQHSIFSLRYSLGASNWTGYLSYDPRMSSAAMWASYLDYRFLSYMYSISGYTGGIPGARYVPLDITALWSSNSLNKDHRPYFSENIFETGCWLKSHKTKINP